MKSLRVLSVILSVLIASAQVASAQISSPLYGLSERSYVWDKIRNHCVEGRCNNDGVWAQLNGYNSSFKNADEDSFALSLGWDRFDYSRNLMYGFYGRYMDLSGDGDGAAMVFGAYGGKFGEKWDFTGVASFGYNNHDWGASDLTAYGLTADFEAAYKMPISGGVLLKPFAGLDVRTLYHGDEGELNSDFYLTARLNTGVQAEYAYNDFDFYGRGELKFQLIDEEPEVKDFGGVLFGISGGTEYHINNNWRLFGNLGYLKGSDYSNFTIGAGVRYAFCPVGRSYAARSSSSDSYASAPARRTQPVEDFDVVVHNVRPADFGIGSLYFNSGVSDLGPNARAYLAKNVRALNEAGFNKIYITGHTDKNEKNPKTVSTARAQKTAQYLMELGVPAQKIAYRGAGAVSPASAAVLRLNRRVDFIVE